MALTDVAIKSARPAEKPIKLSDAGGLYLLLGPNGAKYWRWDYRRPITGRNTLSFGVYPQIPLRLACERRDEAPGLLAAGVDPGTKRRAEKGAQSDSLEAVAREWFFKQKPLWG